MTISAPSKLSVRMHEFFWLKLMKRYYRRYVESFNLKGDEKVLDFGCGPGSTAKFIAQILRNKNGELTCLDISEAWIDRAKKNLNKFPAVHYHAGDIRNWEGREEYFDAVTIHFMLHDIEKSERNEVVRALAEKMKPGAKLFIREPTKEDHGMPPREIRDLMAENRLEEIEANTTKVLMMGDIYTGIFSKTD